MSVAWQAMVVFLALTPGGDDPLKGMAGALRSLLVDALPDPLYEASPGWGNTRPVANGVKWRGQGLRARPEVVKVPRNDGVWRKVKVRANNLKDTLVFDVRDSKNPDKGRTTFTVFLSFDARVEYEQQNWDKGVRLYAGGVKARMRVKLTLSCEATTRLEKNGTFVPDTVFRLRVTQSDLKYDNLVVEHLGGVGGGAAKLLGDAAHAAVTRWRPSVERNLVRRVNAAIVRAGDTREIRIGLGNLLKKSRAKQGDAVGKGHGLFLIVSDEYESDADLALKRFELDLHLASQIGVERGERFVE